MKLLIPIAALLIAVLAFGAFLTRPEPKEQTAKPSFPQEEQSQFEGSTLPTLSSKNMWGSPAKDMFPDISMPKYVSAKEAKTFLEDTDEVFIAKFGSQTYVYPMAILSFHHIVNDIQESQPVAITYCMLSDSALVYDRKLDDAVLDFGVLGPLYAGNLVMYDKKTDSYFLQLTGQSFAGPLKDKKTQAPHYLDRTSWKFAQQDSTVKVLAPVQDMPFYQDFYEKRKASPVGMNSLTTKGLSIDTQMEPLTQGFGIVIHNEALFIPLADLKSKGTANIDSGGWRLFAAYNPKDETYHLWRRYIDGYIHTFFLQDGSLTDKENNSHWNMFGEAVDGPLKGKKTADLSYSQVYWYVWAALFPQTFIFK